MNLVLASASPRRRELLSRLGLDFIVSPVDIDESPGEARDPAILARRLAREKAEAARLRDETATILTADTIVWHDDGPLGKPKDEDDARRMLRSLRGRTHQVVSAVALLPAGKTSPMVRHPLTSVTMRDYIDAEMNEWIARGDPFDKAGGYAIQGSLFAPVSSFEGCYCNVMGLSIYATIELFAKAGIRLPAERDLLPECATCPLAPRTLLTGR